MSPMERVKLSGKGKIWSFTRVFEAPTGFVDQVPYYVAIIELDEGPKITAQLTDFDRDEIPYIDQPVEMVTRKLKVDGDPNTGMIIYGYKFRPIL
jgi:uncharacterized protein